MGLPGGWELVILVLILVAVFGASKLPQMARSLGQSARVLKAEARGFSQDGQRAKADSTTGGGTGEAPRAQQD